MFFYDSESTIDYCFGRTPAQTFEKTLHLAKEKQLDDPPPAAQKFIFLSDQI